MKKFFTDIEIGRLKKAVQITDYLISKGYEPTVRINSEWLFKSPGSNEKTASFYVNVKKNVYFDYSGNNSNTGENGDIIRLVRFLENCDFIEACNKLINSDFAHIETTPPTPPVYDVEKKGIEVLNVQSLRRSALIDYVDSRRISFSLANLYLKEVDYEMKGNRYYAVAFQNDRGGYALRSSIFKGQTNPSYFTTIPGQGVSDKINVFEGFFSALSCLQYYNFDCFKNTTYVLNSVSNLNKLITQLDENVRQVNCFFDNDTAGRKAFEKLKLFEHLYPVDNSERYKGFKDFNELLLSK